MKGGTLHNLQYNCLPESRESNKFSRVSLYHKAIQNATQKIHLNTAKCATAFFGGPMRFRQLCEAKKSKKVKFTIAFFTRVCYNDKKLNALTGTAKAVYGLQRVPGGGNGIACAPALRPRAVRVICSPERADTLQSYRAPALFNRTEWEIKVVPRRFFYLSSFKL